MAGGSGNGTGAFSARGRALGLVLASVGLGALVSAGWSELSSAAPRRAARVACWATDRDAGALVALDRDLLELRRVGLDRPVELGLRSDRGLWVASAGPGGPVGPHELRRLTGEGVREQELAIGALLDLEVVDGQDALLVELASGPGRRVLRVPSAGLAVEVERSPDAFCAAGRRAELLIGGESGSLRLYREPSPVPVAQRDFGGVVSDLAPGPDDGSWFVLDSHGGPNARRLALLERDLSSRWERAAGIAALHLVPVPGAERVWLSDPSGAVARRFGPGGALELSYVPLALVGADRGAARPDGSVVFAAPGALLELDSSGQPRPGQGGFDFLSDVEALPRP